MSCDLSCGDAQLFDVRGGRSLESAEGICTHSLQMPSLLTDLLGLFTGGKRNRDFELNSRFRPV